MKVDVDIARAKDEESCHWCKGGLLFVADQALGTGKTRLCEKHDNEFMSKFAVKSDGV